MANEENLTPPKRTGTGDPGAHDLAETSESEDHFSDAQSAPVSPTGSSPIPRTRVEKVSGEPSYGEVPGTEAYRTRSEDAEPDEIAIIPERVTRQGEGKAETLSSNPGGQPIPMTVVEEVAGTSGPHSDEFKNKRKADAPADLVLKPDGTTEGSGGDVSDTPISPALISPSSARARRKSSRGLQSPLSPADQSTFSQDAVDDEFGDDFDDFEEGGGDVDFGDFEDGFQQADVAASPAPPSVAIQPPAKLSFPIPDFDGLDADDLTNALDPYIDALFPPVDYDLPELPPLSKDNPIFLNPRSASLWSQLVAPPPLAPPDWIRSRIRRLFLVSLGVPVDLDEILPASKQKKLVLPSLHVSGSTRTSTDSRSISRLKQTGANASSTSVDSQGKPSSSKRRKEAPAEPDFDLVSARQVCMTTDEALNGMTEEELKEHISKLESLEGRAKESLEYWKKRTDEKIGDREAFEGVIENLVKHARKVRK